MGLEFKLELILEHSAVSTTSAVSSAVSVTLSCFSLPRSLLECGTVSDRYRGQVQF